MDGREGKLALQLHPDTVQRVSLYHMFGGLALGKSQTPLLWRLGSKAKGLDRKSRNSPKYPGNVPS